MPMFTFVAVWLYGCNQTMPNYADWITRDQVAQRLGVMPRTVAEFIVKGKLKPKKYQRPGVGGGPVNLFDPAEVDALLQERANTKLEIMPAAMQPLRPTNALQAAQPTTAAHVVTLPMEPLPPKRYLMLDEAAQYTGLGKSYIAANAKGRPHGPHGATVYSREELDKL